MSILNVYHSIMIYDDADTVTSNPKKRLPDWNFKLSSETVSKPMVQQYQILPGSTSTIFSGTRTLGIDGTTVFKLEESTISSASGLYRMTSTSGTTPAFRTDRALTLTGEVVTVVINNNVTAEMSLSSITAGSFSAVQVGDTVSVPGPTTGDIATVFNVLNEGLWTVIGKASVSGVTNKKLILTRPTGVDFSGVAESVTLTTNLELQAFSVSGVQVGDSVEVVSGFSTVTQRTFIVTNVAPKFIEFISTDPLPLESGIQPTATGLYVYSSAKRFLRLEVDQNAVVRMNGDSGNTNKLAPRVVGDSENVAYLEKWGNIWSLDIVNKSSVSTMNLTVITAE